VTVNQLTTYLLARSAEYFLETIGMVYENECFHLPEGNKSKLQKTIEDLQSQYKYKPYVSNHKRLVTSIAHLMAYSLVIKSQDVLDDEFTPILKAVKESYFTPDLLIKALSFYTISKTSEAYDLVDLNPAIKPYILRRETFQDVKSMKNIKGVFESVAGEMTTKSGGSYPKTVGLYNVVWEQERGNITKYMDLYSHIQRKTLTKDIKDRLDAMTEV
jgi:hypothetical protein